MKKLLAALFFTLPTTVFALNIFDCANTASDDLNSIYLSPDVTCWKSLVDEDDFKSYGYNSLQLRPQGYKSIVIDKLIVKQKPEDGLTQAILNNVSDNVTESIKTNLQEKFTLTTTPGKETLRLQVLLSEALITGEGIELRDLLPIKAVWNLGKKMLDQNIKVPFMIFESRLTDSETGALVRARVFIVRGEHFAGRELNEDDFTSLAYKTVKEAFARAN